MKDRSNLVIIILTALLVAVIWCSSCTSTKRTCLTKCSTTSGIGCTLWKGGSK